MTDGAFIGQFRACFDAMAADVAQTLTDLGMVDHRPKYSAVIRVVAAELAKALQRSSFHARIAARLAGPSLG